MVLAVMIVVFADDSLSLVETDQAGATKLPVPVIKSARRKLAVLRAATDDRSLRNWKSLHYEKLKGGRDGQKSVRLNDQFRMVFELDERTDPQTVTILSIEDYH
jgi:toxin HigB-1